MKATKVHSSVLARLGPVNFVPWESPKNCLYMIKYKNDETGEFAMQLGAEDIHDLNSACKAFPKTARSELYSYFEPKDVTPPLGARYFQLGPSSRDHMVPINRPEEVVIWTGPNLRIPKANVDAFRELADDIEEIIDDKMKHEDCILYGFSENVRDDGSVDVHVREAFGSVDAVLQHLDHKQGKWDEMLKLTEDGKLLRPLQVFGGRKDVSDERLRAALVPYDPEYWAMFDAFFHGW